MYCYALSVKASGGRDIPQSLALPGMPEAEARGRRTGARPHNRSIRPFDRILLHQRLGGMKPLGRWNRARMLIDRGCGPDRSHRLRDDALDGLDRCDRVTIMHVASEDAGHGRASSIGTVQRPASTPTVNRLDWRSSETIRHLMTWSRRRVRSGRTLPPRCRARLYSSVPVAGSQVHEKAPSHGAGGAVCYWGETDYLNPGIQGIRADECDWVCRRRRLRLALSKPSVTSDVGSGTAAASVIHRIDTCRARTVPSPKSVAGIGRSLRKKPRDKGVPSERSGAKFTGEHRRCRPGSTDCLSSRPAVDAIQPEQAKV